MKTFLHQPLLLLSAIALAGCTTTSTSSNEEFVLPEMQQNTYLSHAKPPQQYGFSVYPVKDGIAMQGKARLHPRHMANARFLKGQIPIIEVRGRSKRNAMNVLLDTSSPTSWMEFTTSQEFNAVFLGHNEQTIPYRGGYNLGKAPAYAGVVSQLRIDQLFMENVPFFIRMAKNSLGPLARGIEVPHIDAVMGNDILSTFEYIQIDLDAETVRFSSTYPYMPHQDLLMSAARIKRVPNYGLAVEGAIFGEQTPILLDFAGDYHFARGDVKVSTTKQVSLGDLVYRRVPTLLLPIHDSPPRAGRRMLKDYIITICNREGVVYFERVPE